MADIKHKAVSVPGFDPLLLAAAVNFSEDSIVITDTELDPPGPRFLYVNPAFTRLTGYTFQEIIGKNPRILQGPKTDRAVIKKLRAALKRGKVFYGCAINYRKDGTPFHMEWHIEPIRNKQGKTTHYLAIQRDASERILAEQAIRDQADALQQKNMALKEILSQIEQEKQKIKEDVGHNVQNVSLPLIKKLKRKGSPIDLKYLDLLEKSLKDLTTSFGLKVSHQQSRLSPREIEIANMVRNGLTSKEIADMLNLSIKTVETHRNKIRKKFGVIKAGVNLTTYLKEV